MKKQSFLIGLHFMMPLTILFILFMPIPIYAGDYYKCIDSNGNEIITNQPIDMKTCKLIGVFQEITAEEVTKYRKEKENNDKKRVEVLDRERAERETEEKVQECYNKAQNRHRDCMRDCERRINTTDERKTSAYVACEQRCDYNLQQERNQCLQRYNRRP